MNKKDRHITVFEHQRLRYDVGEKRISKDIYETLVSFYGNGSPYFDLIHNGVKFNEYVGVLQVNGILIEVLPKADKNPDTEAEEKRWRAVLIDMMRTVGGFNIQAPSTAHLKIRPNTILDLYFGLFIEEVEYLLHTGLVKQYRKTEGNATALKGSLQFPRHIQQNLVHPERFYVRHTVYDAEHRLHFILYKTLRLLYRINTNASLHSRIGALLLNFPEMPDIRVTEALFEKLKFNRKTLRYKKAIEIAKMLLLNYHPDVAKGRHDVLALMFDMNLLWEQFIYATLRGLRTEGVSINAQFPRKFWKPDHGKSIMIRPDIWIQKDAGNIILDTKWKNLNGNNPSADDLRQMYVYHDYFGAKKVALVYPGEAPFETSGAFWSPDNTHLKDKICFVVMLAVPEKAEASKTLVGQWQDDIRRKFEKWLD
ncbi:MAG: restriction endonuclease [Saprospiraceae bacterium]